jgi:hypothetical protein
MKYQKTGGCLCGKCRYSFESDKFEVGACHCAMCRKWAGAPVMGLHIDGPVVIEDESSLKWYDSSEWGQRGFCEYCGSNLFWATKDRSMMVPFAGSLDDDTGLKFTSEIFIDDKPEFYEFANKTVQKTGAEVMAEFSDK